MPSSCLFALSDGCRRLPLMANTLGMGFRRCVAFFLNEQTNQNVYGASNWSSICGSDANNGRPFPSGLIRPPPPAQETQSVPDASRESRCIRTCDRLVVMSSSSSFVHPFSIVALLELDAAASSSRQDDRKTDEDRMSGDLNSPPCVVPSAWYPWMNSRPQRQSKKGVRGDGGHGSTHPEVSEAGHSPSPTATHSDGSDCHSDGGKPEKKRRTAFTSLQVFELEKRFQYQRYLVKSDRRHLAVHLGLTDRQIKTWFQNRRTKLKRQNAEAMWDDNVRRRMMTNGGGCCKDHRSMIPSFLHVAAPTCTMQCWVHQ
eukprot:m.43713 g.43713  ORF g.43713 m.43713 type:complete len:314 (+) comp33470_c0_seq1:1655-2596(+)